MKKMASERLVTLKWLSVALSFLLASFFSVIHSEVQAQDFTARQIGDYGNVTVMEVTGNYDEHNADGTINAVPRQVIAQEFFKTHKDDYDFLVIFTKFDFTLTSDTAAFYLQIKNDIRGIGQDIFDNSHLYGSAGKLQGTIDMGNIAKIATDPLSPEFEFTLDTLGHEMLHRWGSYVKFKDQAGSISKALLGKDDAHWSFLLDTKGSLEYGNQWQDNGNGTFTSVAVRKYYSPLDLYLMGMIDKSQVPPMLLIENPSIDPNKMPEVGAMITGTPRYVTIDDIIAAEGERIPGSKDAQKQFKTAFIFVTAPGTFTGDELYGIESIRNGFLPRYSVLTDGKGLVQVASTPKDDIPVNPGVLPPTSTPRVLPPSIDDGIKWLTTHQQADGSWTDFSLTTERDTAEAITALQLFPAAQLQFSAGLQWLGANLSASTDFLARRLEAIANGGGNGALHITQLLDRRNTDGGWGSGRGFISNPIDTALTLRALSRASFSDQAIIDAGLAYLKGTQNNDGGWSGNDTVSAIQPTAEVVRIFNTYRKSYDLENQISLGRAFLTGKQNADGGFGNSPSTVYDTAQSVLALLDAGGGSSAVTYAGLQYLRNSQSATGSWNESAYQTALAVQALLRDDTDLAPDLEFDSNAMTTIYPITTIPANVTVNGIIRNLGRTNVPSATVVLYEGLNKVAESNIAIAAQGSATVVFPLNINDNSHHYYKMEIDPVNTVNESNENNNYILIKIENNVQKPTVGFTQTVSSGSESVTSVKVPVSLDKPWFEPVTVAYSASIKSTASSPADFTLNPGTLTFNPGETVKFIDISVVDNPSPGPNRTVVIDLYEPDIILYEIDRKAVITNSRHTYTILDSKPVPAVRIFSPVAGVTRENAPRLIYAVDSGTVKVMVDGVAVSTTSGGYLGTLSDGSHTVRVESTNGTNTGFAEVSFTVYTGTEAPYENALSLYLHKTDPTAIDKFGNYYVVIQNEGLQKLDSSGKKLWQSVVPMDEVRNIAIDSEGSVYAAGCNFNNATDAVLVKYDSQGVQQWMHLFDSNVTEAAQGIAVDKNDNVYLTGMTTGDLARVQFSLSSTVDLFVTKLDKKGSIQWARQLPIQNFYSNLLIKDFLAQMPTGLAVDDDGNVYVAGPTDRTLSDTPNAGGFDYFLYKFDTDGVVKWVRQEGTGQTDWAHGVAVDSLGGVYVIGETGGGLDGNTNLGSSDAYVVKYDSSGTKLWTRQLGSSLSDKGHAIIAEKNGVFYAAFEIDGHDVVTKYGISGNQIWTKEIDHGSFSCIDRLLLGANGYLYLSWDVPVAPGDSVYIDKLRDPRLPQVAFDKNTFQVNSGTASISGTMETGALITVKLDPGAFPGTVTYPTPGSWQCTFNGLVEGANLVIVTAKNSLGFTDSAAATVVLDTVAPIVQIVSPVEGQTYLEKPNLIYTVSDGTVKVRVNGVEVFKHSGFPLDSLSPGLNFVRVEVTNEAGSSRFAEVAIFAEGAAVGELPYGTSWAQHAGFTRDSLIQMSNSLIVGDTVSDFVRDGAGNYYVTGTTSGGLDGKTIQGQTDVFVMKFDAQGNKLGPAWLIGTTNVEYGSRIAVDTTGNIYLAWTTEYDPVTASGTNLTDVNVVKFDSTGNQLWTQQLGSSNEDYLSDIAVDENGNVLITGDAAGSVDNKTFGGVNDFFVAKYDTNGVKQWTKLSGQKGYDGSYDIALDKSGNIYITGETESGLNGLAANNSPFLVKYNTSGVVQWTKIIDSQHAGSGYSVAVDGAGNCYVTGSVTVTGWNLFLAKYDGAGNQQWISAMETAGDDVWGLALDATGNVFITGYASGIFDGNSYRGGSDIFVVKFDVNGKKLWSTQIGNDNNDYPADITVDPDGNVYLLGDTYGSILGTSSPGNKNLFIMQLKQLLPDTIPPTVTVTPVESPTNSEVITLTGTMEEGAMVTVTADTAALIGSVAYPTASTWSCTVSGLPEGVTHFTVKATDAGGLSSTANATVTRDSTPPVIQITSPKGFVKNSSPILNYTVNEGTATVRLDNVVISKFSGSALGPLADGSHTLYIDAVDTAGNSSSADSPFTVDTVPPSLSINPVSIPTSVANQTLSGTTEVGSVITLSTNGTASIGTVIYPTQTTWQCMVSNLAAGLNTITVTATDQAGNNSLASVTIDYKPGVAIALSKGTIAADYRGNVALTIGNLSPSGSEVVVEQFVDANQNDVIDTGDYVIRSFRVTDGTPSTNPNVQGDEDGMADATIRTSLNYLMTNDVYHAPGRYLFRVASGTTTAVAAFNVTPVSRPQAIHGLVSDGAGPVPGALVRLLDKWQRHVGYTVADGTGNYSVAVDYPGQYYLVPYAYGYAARNAIPAVTIASGQTVFGLDVALVKGDNRLYGKVTDTTGTTGVDGVWIVALSSDYTGVAITDSNGSFDLTLPAGQYEITSSFDLTTPNPSTKGYLGIQRGVDRVSLPGYSASIEFKLPRPEVFVTGRVTDPSGNPLGGVPIEGRQQNYMFDQYSESNGPRGGALTDSDGNYSLGLGLGDKWNMGINQDYSGYVGAFQYPFSTSSNSLSGNNLTAGKVTAWIEGRLTGPGDIPLRDAEIRVKGAINGQAGTVRVLKADADGTYSVGVGAGRWDLLFKSSPDAIFSDTIQSVDVADGETKIIDVAVITRPPLATMSPVRLLMNKGMDSLAGTRSENVGVSLSLPDFPLQVQYPTPTTWSSDPLDPGLFREGDNIVTFYGFDGYGSDVIYKNITIEQSRPVVTITSPAVNAAYATAPMLQFSVSDQNPVTVEVRVDGKVVQAYSGDFLDLSAGNHTIFVGATDIAGNTGFSSLAFTVGNSPIQLNVVEDFETGDLSKLPWVLSGEGMWSVVPGIGYNASYGAKSPSSLQYGQNAVMEVTYNCVTNGTVQFLYEVDGSSNDYSALRFYIDGIENLESTLQSPMAWASFAVASGKHSFKWVYSRKNSWNSSGNNAVVLDFIKLNCNVAKKTRR
ncbi:SBBP repeat-containing protein [Geobacter sp.]|uniref:SBBP repeat-containing protein n=1 Tax=Geobacter sp. TaxID=46610 RepID=UPI00261503EA|nr:SBBP repeat-containing protein [Geobacter sp.]